MYPQLVHDQQLICCVGAMVVVATVGGNVGGALQLSVLQHFVLTPVFKSPVITIAQFDTQSLVIVIEFINVTVIVLIEHYFLVIINKKMISLVKIIDLLSSYIQYMRGK